MTPLLPFLALAALVFCGCISPRNIVFIDEPPPAARANPTISHIRAEGDILHVTLVQDTAPAWVAAIDARVIADDVYLSTIHISTPVHAAEFAVNLSDPKFPRDWRKRLYWIVEDSISSPINPLIEHKRWIRRSKISVAE